MAPLKPYGITATAAATTICTLAVVRGLKKKTLSKNGAAAAFCVGFGSVGSGLRGFVLLMFYQIASSATKYKKELKEAQDATAAEGSVRGASQVLCCSAVATALSIYHAIMIGPERRIDFGAHRVASSLTCAILAHHATCLADTMASELGMLAKSQPVLITEPWKRVPPGTNGGVTLWGTSMSALGGGLMGLGTAWMDWCSGLGSQTPQLVLYGAVCGLVGSGLDSLLGATVQATYYADDEKRVHHEKPIQGCKQIAGRAYLSNAQVNLVSVCLTTVLGGWVLGPWMLA